MNLISMTIPEDPAALGGWLERQLVGLDLSQLVAELTAIHGAPTSARPNLRRHLGNRLEEVCQTGLNGLPSELLQGLLTQPALLLELQELVLTQGGPYWDHVAAGLPQIEALVERGQVRLAGLSPSSRPARLRVAWYRQPWLVSLATAAIVLLLVHFLGRLPQPGNDPKPTPGVEPVPVAQGWGWSKPGALAANVAAPEYLDRLAESAQEWFRNRPEDTLGLARRISEFRRGCSTLLLSEHKPLSPEERQWLVNRCRTWAAKLDKNLAEVEAGGDVLKSREDVDATARQMVEALRSRADHLRG